MHYIDASFHCTSFIKINVLKQLPKFVFILTYLSVSNKDSKNACKPLIKIQKNRSRGMSRSHKYVSLKTG